MMMNVKLVKRKHGWITVRIQNRFPCQPLSFTFLVIPKQIHLCNAVKMQLTCTQQWHESHFHFDVAFKKFTIYFIFLLFFNHVNPACWCNCLLWWILSVFKVEYLSFAGKIYCICIIRIELFNLFSTVCSIKRGDNSNHFRIQLKTNWKALIRVSHKQTKGFKVSHFFLWLFKMSHF